MVEGGAFAKKAGPLGDYNSLNTKNLYLPMIQVMRREWCFGSCWGGVTELRAAIQQHC
jgi:hypothetical protein